MADYFDYGGRTKTYNEEMPKMSGDQSMRKIGTYHQQRQQRIDQRIDEAFPSQGTVQPSHMGSQSDSPNKDMQ